MDGMAEIERALNLLERKEGASFSITPYPSPWKRLTLHPSSKVATGYT